MTEIWKRLTSIEGMTAQQLAGATGAPVREVRAELNRLQGLAKVARWHAPVGKSDLWWRWDQRPISDHTIILCLALALDAGKSDKILRNILQLGAKRGWTPGLRGHLAQIAQHRQMRYMVAEAIRYYCETNNLPTPAADSPSSITGTPESA